VNVANNSGAGTITGAGGLNVTSLTLDGAASFSWSANAQLTVDTFTINSSASSVTIGSAAIWTTSATPYTILSATNIAGSGAGLGAFALGDVTANFTGLTPRQTATAALLGNTITLTIAGDNYPKWTGNESSAWNTTATNNWQLVNGGATTTFINNDQVLFDDTASTGTVTIDNGNVSVSSVTFNNSTLDYTVSGANGITGGGGLTKSGTGTVTLGTVNSYTGGNAINAGTLVVTGTLGSGATTISNGATLQIGTGGTTGAFSDTSAITNNGTLAFNRSNALSEGVDFGTISGTGALVKSGAGALTLGSANTYSGGTTVNAGTIIFGNNQAFGTGAITLNGGGLKAAGGFTLANNIVVASASTIDMASNNTGLSGNLSGSGALTFTTSGVPSTLTLSGNNSGYSGTITINASNAVSFNSANAGSASAAWVFNDTAGDRVRINAGNGTLEFGSIAGGGQMQNDTAGTTTTLSVGALGTSTTFSGTMKDNGTGKLALAKVGAGTLTLTGANAYTGGTTINGGTLMVNGTVGGAVTVNSSGTLAGTGTVGTLGTGAVTLNSGGTITPGTGSLGTLTTAGDLTWMSGGAMNFDLSTVDNTSALLQVNGTFDLAGGSNFTFNFTGGQVGQTYLLVFYNTAGSGLTSGSQFAANGLGGDFTLDSGTLTFTVTSVPEPGTVVLMVMGLGGMMLIMRRGRRAL
jgi:autotransporter-associated beta strand protein